MTYQDNIRRVGEGAVWRCWSAHIDNGFSWGQRPAGGIGKGATDQHGSPTQTMIAATTRGHGRPQEARKHRRAPLDFDHHWYRIQHMDNSTGLAGMRQMNLDVGDHPRFGDSVQERGSVDP